MIKLNRKNYHWTGNIWYELEIENHEEMCIIGLFWVIAGMCFYLNEIYFIKWSHLKLINVLLAQKKVPIYAHIEIKVNEKVV